MPDRDPRSAPPANPVLHLGPECEFEGLVALNGPARIEGTLRGEIVSDGLVWIGESARVAARIEAEEIVIAGRVEGDVYARGRIALLPTARISGSVQAPSLALAEGAAVNGPCRVGSAAAGGGSAARAAAEHTRPEQPAAGSTGPAGAGAAESARGPAPPPPSP